MGSHPFREAPPESSSGAHCVQCGSQRPHAQLGLDVDGSVICAQCRPAPAVPARVATDLTESLTKHLVGTLLALATLAWIISYCVR